MAIHHIINDYNLAHGGAQRLVLDLHKGGLDEGLSSKLLGLSKSPIYNIQSARSLHYQSVYKLIIFIKLWRYFKEEVNAGDIVHVHLFPSILYVSLLSIFKLLPKCKLILTEHSTSNKRRNKLWGKWVDYLTYKSYHKIIAISKGTAEAFLEWKPSMKEKVQIINNGAHLTFDNYVIRKQKLRPVIVSIGRLHALKNYRTALNAVAELKNLNVEYWIAGSGQLKNELISQATQLKINHKVKFLGFVSDIPELLKKVDIFLMPSLWEGFGLAAIEAMNASLPCVVANVPGLGDLIKEDGDDAFLVAPANKNIIAQRLDQLIENKELRYKMGKKAFIQSLNFGIDTMIKNYIELYKEVYHE